MQILDVICPVLELDEYMDSAQMVCAAYGGSSMYHGVITVVSYA